MSTVPGRSNGLSAAAYVALIDVAPPLADALLDMLRREAIAAYAAPATDRPLVELAARATPARPLDRVFVDRSASARARVMLDIELPRLRAEPRPPDVVPEADSSAADVDEDVWAGLVAAFDAPSTVRDWPEAEDIADAEDAGDPGTATPPGAPEDPRERAPGDDGRVRVVRAMSFEAIRPPESAADRAAEEEHFVPPVPPPLPRLDPIGKAAWLGVIGAPALLVVLALLGIDIGGWTGLGLVAAFVGGFVTLVVRMGEREDEGWDDGAVV